MKYTTSLALLGVASLAAADMQQSKRSHSPGKCNSDKPGHGHGCGDHGHGHGHGCAVDKDFIKAGDLEFGILPDDSSTGGITEHVPELDMTIGGRFAATGRYTQTYPDVEYDGLQLYVELGYVMASGGAYHISLMPKGDSYQGLLPGNDSNAVSFCNHVKNITSYVPDVSVRLFHEMNYDGEYQDDGKPTYPNDIESLMVAYKHTFDTCKSIVPDVPLGWCPNVASNITDLEPFWPGDDYADFVCMDYYPETEDDMDFEGRFADFYETYVTEDHPMRLGEVGLHFNGTPYHKISWLDQIVKASQTSMPLIQSLDWFNFDTWVGDRNDYRIVDPFLPEMNEALLNYLNTGAIPSNSTD